MLYPGVISHYGSTVSTIIGESTVFGRLPWAVGPTWLVGVSLRDPFT